MKIIFASGPCKRGTWVGVHVLTFLSAEANLLPKEHRASVAISEQRGHQLYES
jgi:hypothetical protein